MVLIGLLSSVFGFVFVVRTLRQWQSQALLSKEVLTKFGTTYYLILILSHGLSDSIFWITLNAFTPVFVFYQAEFFIHLRCRRKLSHGLFPLVQETILSMKMGSGFRSAFQKAIERSEDIYFRKKLGDLMQSVVFSQQVTEGQSVFPRGSLGEWCREFRKIDQQGHRAVERLENLRRKLQIENDFRRRSGQLLAQLHLQSGLLALLYLFLMVFVMAQFGFLSNWKLILLSFTLFLIGLVLSYLLGGKIKWKV